MGDGDVEPQEPDRRSAAQKVGCLLGLIVLFLLTLPFLMKL